jgi:hypothetical protein
MTYELPLLDLTGNFPVKSVQSCPWSTRKAYKRWDFVPNYVSAVGASTTVAFEVDLMFWRL